MDNISPEEKLLRLIRGPGKHHTAAGGNPSGNPPGFKSRVKESVLYLIRKFTGYLDVSKAIRFGLAACAIYLVFSLFYPLVFLRNIKIPRPIPEKAVDLSAQPKTEAKPYDFYLNGIGERRVFTGSGQSPSGPAVNMDADFIKDINLVGVISGDDPQAIVENKKTSKTYYLRKGQLIEGAQIDDIQEGRIILNYKGQKYELHI